jgi:hypothetical protein
MMRRCNGHKVGRLSVEFKRLTKNSDYWSQNNKNIKHCISTMIAFEAKSVFFIMPKEAEHSFTDPGLPICSTNYLACPTNQ